MLFPRAGEYQTFSEHANQCTCREEIDDLAAFQRQYENDHSWEDLQEDEFGRLLSLVRPLFCIVCQSSQPSNSASRLSDRYSTDMRCVPDHCVHE